MTERTAVGKPTVRADARAMVTGEVKYTADIQLPGMLYGKILRSPHPHAKIISVDYSEALKLPGVEAVVTAKDVPGDLYGEFLVDEPLFAKDEVRHIGERIAAVAAVDEAIAEKALDLIKVEYELLPAILDMEEALKPDAPMIHPDIATYRSIYPQDDPIIKYGNVNAQIKIKRGDVEKAFKEADFIIEDRFTTSHVQNGYIETHAATASVDRSGNITVWSSTQGVFETLEMLANMFHMPNEKIRVICPKLGGAFGGKMGEWFLEPSCIALTLKTSRPVKMMMTRQEEFWCGNFRAPTIMELKTGVKKDGTIIARQARFLYDAGGYATQGPVIANVGALRGVGTYNIPNVKIDSYSVYTNNPVTGPTRGFGGPQGVFSVECHTDSIAEKLGMDPREFRLKNILESGQKNCCGQVFENIAVKQTLLDATAHAGWGKKKEGKNRGLGVACAEFNAGGMTSSAIIRLNDDGTVKVMSGLVDNGMGAETVMRQIAAEVIGVPMERVSIVTADTATCPFEWATIADRLTVSTGNSVHEAAMEVRRQILERVAEKFHCRPDELEIKNSLIFVKARPQQAIPLIAITKEAAHGHPKGPIMGKGAFCFDHPHTTEPGAIRGGLESGLNLPNYTTQVAEVEVNENTGEVKVLKVTASEDVGFAMNPLAIRSQITSGIVMGQGWALTEGSVLKDGMIMNQSLVDNGLPGVLDAPAEMEILVLEENAKMGAFGARSMGNTPLLPTAPAISNAIFDAVGVRMKDLPITPEKVLAAIKEKKAREAK